MEFIDVVKSRRSVRSFSSDEVENEKIEQILECARIAPSWANKQCWSFIVIKDKERINLLCKAGGIVNDWIKSAPVIIVACGNPKLSGVHNGMDYFLVDVAIATQQLVLSATDLGLGTCWIGYFNEKKIKEILGIPADIRVVAIIPVGYPADKMGVRENITRFIAQSKKRKSLSEIVHYEKW